MLSRQAWQAYRGRRVTITWNFGATTLRRSLTSSPIFTRAQAPHEQARSSGSMISSIRSRCAGSGRRPPDLRAGVDSGFVAGASSMNESAARSRRSPRCARPRSPSELRAANEIPDARSRRALWPRPKCWRPRRSLRPGSDPSPLVTRCGAFSQDSPPARPKHDTFYAQPCVQT
jgi:hypothetical protein